jgi:hypothetical protein
MHRSDTRAMVGYSPLVVEVALSQSSDGLEDKVCEYMKGSNGKVKTVIGIDLPYCIKDLRRDWQEALLRRVYTLYIARFRQTRAHSHTSRSRTSRNFATQKASQSLDIYASCSRISYPTTRSPMK